MPQWVDTESGQVVEGPCPFCAKAEADAEIQVRAMEAERRRDRNTTAKAIAELEGTTAAKRDGKAWAELLTCWQLAFPHKKIKVKSITSARAKAVFQRLGSGVSVEDFKDAIAGAIGFPYVVFGVRRASGSDSDLAIDLQDIASLNRDSGFEFLVSEGHKLRNPDGENG